MAYATVYLTNGVEVKKAPVGFSWTVFFFGLFPPFFRQDWLWGFGLLVAAFFVGPLAGIVASFIYNKVYIKSLIAKGYKFSDTSGVSETQLKQYLGYIELPRA